MIKSSNMQKLKIGVVGCGHWGKNLVRNFSDLGVLQYVCDTNIAHSKEIAKKYNVESKTIAELLKTDIDGVVIATPAEEHYNIAKSCLEEGKHVFVEKPLSLKVSEAIELYKLSKKKKKVLMVGHLLQYHSAFSKLKKMVSEGKLGKLNYIYSNRLNLGKFRNEENILWSFAPHDISMILGLADDLPETVYATGVSHLNKDIHDVTTTHLKFKNGLQAHVFVSWLHPFKEQKLIVVGDKSMAVFDDGLSWADKLKIYPHKVNWINGLPHPQKAEFKSIELDENEPLKVECDTFINSIKNKNEPITDGKEGINVLKVLDASQKSLIKGTIINLVEISSQEIDFFKHNTAVIDQDCIIGKGTKIWHYSHILGGTKIGEKCTIGQNVMIGPDVIVGDKCKIQNNVSLYKGVKLKNAVFCGPSCVFTNVINPRAKVDRTNDFLETCVEEGATIGANSTIVCGNKIGAYSLVGAGAVITKNVKPHSIMVGNPAKQIGWVSHSGEKLDKNLKCPRENRQYYIDKNNNLKEVK